MTDTSGETIQAHPRRLRLIIENIGIINPILMNS